MATFQGLFLVVIGIGLAAVTYQSLSTGWLPCGPNGFRGQVRFRRATQPLRYWLMFGVYAAAGLWAASYGFAVLVGAAAPLPLT